MVDPLALLRVQDDEVDDDVDEEEDHHYDAIVHQVLGDVSKTPGHGKDYPGAVRLFITFCHLDQIVTAIFSLLMI